MPQATHIYRNGTILTHGFPAAPSFPALPVSGETILAVGSEAEVAPFQGPETRIVDLGGRFTTPGFQPPPTAISRARACTTNTIST